MEGKMRTTLNIDDEALADYARRKRRRGLLELRGKERWQGDLDRLRSRG